MFTRFGTNLSYQGIGLKRFSELTDWYFKQIDTTFNNTFAYAKSVASAPPVYSRQRTPTAPIYTRV